MSPSFNFDLDAVKAQSMDNPVYYLQYAHARMCSLERFAREQGVERQPLDDVDLTVLDHPAERVLLREADRLGEEIREAATRRAEDESERILADARATAERIRRDASAAVDQELRRAQAELREEAADLALEIAATKLAENVSDGDRERLMDEFITRVEPSGAEGAQG